MSLPSRALLIALTALGLALPASAARADYAVSHAVDTTTPAVGEAHTLTVSVSNPGTTTAQGVQFTTTYTGGVAPSTVTGPAGSTCSVSGSTVGCTLADIVGGGSVAVQEVFQALSAGKANISSNLTATGGDFSVNDNTASTDLTVVSTATPPPPPPPPPPPGIPPLTYCAVPSVIGSRLQDAQREIVQRGCLVGTVKRPKKPKHHRKHRFLLVARQSLKEAVRVPVGTKVNLVLRYKRLG